MSTTPPRLVVRSITAAIRFNVHQSVAYPWAIYDGYDPGTGFINSVIAGNDYSWLTLSGGAWQNTITRTYTGTPYDHTITFYANDLGHGTGVHGFSSMAIGNITVDPFFVDAGPDVSIAPAQQGGTIINGTAIGIGLTYRWREGATVLQGYQPVGGLDNAPLALGTLSPLSTGSHTLTLEITDGSASSSDTMVLTVGAAVPSAVGYDARWLAITSLALTAAGGYLLRIKAH